MNQYYIEQYAGITNDAIAQYIASGKTPAAKNALSLLAMNVNFCEQGSLALLKCAVEDCKKEMQNG